MAARLKVFGWSDGFHRFTVAAASRPKALEAWGAQQDLFKSGLATEVEAGPDRDAALASPGVVISTGVAVDPGEIPRRRGAGHRPRTRRSGSANRRCAQRSRPLRRERPNAWTSCGPSGRRSTPAPRRWSATPADSGRA